VNTATPSRKPVSQPARQHQQGGVDDRVAVQHPGQIAEVGLVQLAGDLRQGHVDDEQVQAGHDHPGADDQQDLTRLDGPAGPGRRLLA
jgi:hypothetical protein